MAGILLVVGVSTAMDKAVQVAGALGVLAAISLYAQLGFSDPILDGNSTSAAPFLSVAVVAFMVGRTPDRTRELVSSS